MSKESMNRFLSNMSHEIRSPLNVMIGMCDIARHHIDDKEKVLECLQKINIAGDHLTKLINNILDISKIEQGRLLILEETFDVDDLVGELETLLEPLANDKSIIFSISSKGVVNKMVSGDYSHIMQVIINLATNSIKYTPQGGFVKLWVEERDNPSIDRVTYRFVCQDNGIGMSEEFLAHVFEPFTRADDIRVNKVVGAGLGMSISKEIIDALGGSIHIDSTKDVGTTVSVELELKTASGEKPIRDIEEFKRQERRKLQDKKIILIAEDLADNREVLQTHLEDLGFEVNSAEDGEAVVDMFIESEEGFYKAIFMDIEMPVMDGYQATMMIRGLNRSDNNIPIIAMTGKAFESDKTNAKKAGMNDYLIKPLKINKLNRMLKTWLKEKDE